jgi:uncharacterized membrane protein
MIRKGALVTFLPNRSRPLNAFGASEEIRAYPLHVRRRFQKRRSMISRALLVVDVAALVLTLASVDGLARMVTGLILVLIIPGWSIVGLLRLDNGPLEAALTVAVSLAVLTLAAQLLMTIHFWHLHTFQAIVCVVCAWPLAYQSRTVEVFAKQRS